MGVARYATGSGCRPVRALGCCAWEKPGESEGERPALWSGAEGSRAEGRGLSPSAVREVNSAASSRVYGGQSSRRFLLFKQRGQVACSLGYPLHPTLRRPGSVPQSAFRRA
jgi:hypothetical protein